MIRPATVEDVPRLVAMGERFLTETVYRGRVPINPPQMAHTLAYLIEADLGAVFVVERAAQLVGMIGLLFFVNPVSGEPTVSELFWWMEPEHRGHGVRLLKRAEQWGRDVGARKVHMIAPTPEVGQLYERLGYQALETAYDKAIA